MNNNDIDFDKVAEDAIDVCGRGILLEDADPYDKIEADLEKVFGHMLKYKYQPDKQTSSWIYSITSGGINEIKKIMDQGKNRNKNFKKYFEDNAKMDKIYQAGKEKVAEKDLKNGLKNAKNSEEKKKIEKALKDIPAERPQGWTFKNITDTEYMNKFLSSNACTKDAKRYVKNGYSVK